MGSSEKFGVVLHFGGRFEEIMNTDYYVGGKDVMTRDHDPDLFGYFDVKDLVEKYGFISWKILWYKLPLSDSFRMIESDKEVIEMLSFLTPFIRVLHVYVENGVREDGAKQDGIVSNLFMTDIDDQDWKDIEGNDEENEIIDFGLGNEEDSDYSQAEK